MLIGEVMPKKATKNNLKQMKLFLNPQEHAVVTAAANLKSMFIKDYMKQVVLDQAKKDTKSWDKIIETV